MLTRSMRFPHDPPAGNSGRGEVDDGEAELGAKKRGTGRVFKARISFGSDLAREGRAMKRLRHERNSIYRDFHHDVVDVDALAPPPLELLLCV